MKRSRKLVSILLTLSLLAAMLIPMASPAFAGAAAASIVAMTTPTVSDSDAQTLGTIKVTVPAGQISNGDAIIFKLPSGYDFGSAFNPVAQNAAGANDNRVYVPNNYQNTANAAADVNGLQAGNIAVTVLDADDEVQITANADQSLTNDFVFYIYLRDVDVEEDTNDDCVVTFDGPSGSGFPMGTVAVAKVAPSGSVTLTASGQDTGNNLFTFDLRVKENVLGGLELENETIKLTLPDGFSWTTGAVANENSGAAGGVADTVWGENIDFDVNVDDEELTIDFNGVNGVAPARATNRASCWEFSLAFQVDNERKAQAGDIKVKVNGESTISPEELVVGTYGEYGATVSAKSTPDVYSGMVEQEIGDIIIKESIGESLTDGRYITFTLPGAAKWTSVPNTETDNGITLNFAGVAGSEGETIKYTVANPAGGNDEAELKLEDLEVAIDAGFSGDLKVQVGGTAGVTGEIVVAKVQSSVTVKAEGKPELKIGVAAQKYADIVITETKAGAIQDATAIAGAATSLVLKVPAGCEFAKLPKVTVESGDLDIDETQVRRAKTIGATQPTDYYQYLVIPIDNDSNTASTIKVSDIYVSVDRTVAEGDLKVAVLGSAVLESNTAYAGIGMNINGAGGNDYTVGANGMFPATAAITSAVGGVIVTPAPGEAKANASFVIGSTKYAVAGVEKEMDVAPYIKNGRTYLPVRYVAEALGVSSDNILWDAATQKVTLLKGDKVVQMTIGSKTLLVNGVTIAMDVPAEITSGRTMLPFRFIAQALGASVGWDEATQTVSLN